MRWLWLPLAIAALGCGRQEHATGLASSAGGSAMPNGDELPAQPTGVAPLPAPSPASSAQELTEDLTLSFALVMRMTTDGPRAAIRTSRGKLLAATAEGIRELARLLPQPGRSAVRVEQHGDAIQVRALPKSARLALVVQAPHPRIKQLFQPLRSEALRSKGAVRYFPQGNGTLRADDSEERARDLLGRWLGRIPSAPDVRYVYRNFCPEVGRRDLAIDVVSTSAVLSGPFVKRIRVVLERTPSVDTEALITDLVPGSGEALFELVTSISAGNQCVMLVWGDRIMWRSWLAILNPDPDGAFTKASLSVRAEAQDCPSPALEQIAERVRVATLLEEARRAEARR